MKRLLVGISVVIASVILADLFYFRFHTYFQRTEVSEAMPAAAPGSVAAPRTVASGSFVELDAFHKGSGIAKIIEQGGRRYLRFENFRVTNGPDLYVYLSESAAPGKTLGSLGAYVNLGSLKGNVGDQNYELPPGATGATAVIWCRQFGVLFSYAVMR